MATEVIEKWTVSTKDYFTQLDDSLIGNSIEEKAIEVLMSYSEGSYIFDELNYHFVENPKTGDIAIWYKNESVPLRLEYQGYNPKTMEIVYLAFYNKA